MSNQQQGGQKPRREPHVFDDNKLYLYAKGAGADGRAPRLRVKMYENNPVIDIDYAKKTEKGYPIAHETPLDPIVFNTMLGYIELAARSKGPMEWEFDNWGFPFMWDKELGKNARSKEKMNISVITIGRHESGEVYIKYKTARNAEVEFQFTENSDWHRIQQGGNPVPPGQSSGQVALAWISVMRTVYNTYFVTNWAEPEWKKKKRLENMQKFGNGNRGNQGNGNNNYQQRPQQQQQQQPVMAQPSAEFDDDDFPY